MGSEIEARGSLKRGFHSFRLWWLMSLGIDSLIYVPPRYRHVKTRTCRNEAQRAIWFRRASTFPPIPQARSRRRQSSKRQTGEKTDEPLLHELDSTASGSSDKRKQPSPLTHHHTLMPEG